MPDNILGVIPARAGSKGIPRKNLLELGGRTLLELAIASARESELLTRTIVSTEDEELAGVARGVGAEVPFVRPAELATDTASSWSVLRHAFEWLRDDGWEASLVVLLQPTTPFRRGRHIDETIRRVLETGADSAMTVREPDYPPHWMLRLDGDGRLTRLIETDRTYTRRQDTPRAYQPNGLVYAFRPGVLYEFEQLPARDTRAVPMSWEESINIDDLWQYRLAQVLWQGRAAR